MSPIGSISIGLVVLWLVATAAYQHAYFRRMLARFDQFELLPSWSFFAPNPATRDSHIVVRDMHSDGSLGAWAAVSFFPSRTPLHLVWHPAKRPRKILRDASKAIKRTQQRATSKGVVQCSLPYLLLLHHCMAENPSASNAVARQFMVVETSGRENRRLWITFISDFHPF